MERLGQENSEMMVSSSAERIGVIDIGTNTALLLVASWDNGRLIPIHNAAGFVRLGEGVDASGRGGPPALERLTSVLASHVREAALHNVHSFTVTGTSASRDASNADEIRSIVRNETGAELRILSGDEEARVTFTGALAGLAGDLNEGSFTSEGAPVTVVDVGGGSTECVQGDALGGSITFKRSLDMGSVRMTERFFRSQPPSKDDIEAASTACRAMMTRELCGIEQSELCIGASGTAILLSLLHQEKNTADPFKGGLLDYVDVVRWSEHLLKLSREEVLALMPLHAKGREDVFAVGVLMLRLVMEHVEANQLSVSPFGVRHGVAMEVFKAIDGRS